MGRRKKAQTLEELADQKAYEEEELRKLQNQIKLTKNKQSKEERKLRTRRLCREAGVLEHYVPDLKNMDEETSAEFIRIISTGPEAEKFLREVVTG